MKRRIAALLLLLILLPFCPLEAAETEKTSYLWAEGVGAGSGTSAYTTEKGTQACATDERAHGGTYSMKVYNKTENMTRLWLEAENLVPGKAYTATAYVYLTHQLSGNTGAQMRVGATFKVGQSAAWARTSNIKKEVGVWTAVSLTFTQPEGTQYATLILDTGKIPENGAVYWDDVTLSDYENLGGDFEAVETRYSLKEVLPELPAGAINIVQNSSFETLSSSIKPASWNAYDGDLDCGWSEANPYVSLSSAYAHTGSCSVQLTATDAEDRPWTSQGFTAEPLTSYIVSAYVYVVSISGSAVIKFECYDENGTTVGFFNSKSVSAAAGEWVELRQRITTVKDCAKIGMVCRLSGTGEIYYDDIAVYKEGESAAFDLSTDGVFYYEDQQTGTAVVTQLAGRDYTGCTVDFALLDGKTVKDSAGAVAFADGVAKWEFPLGDLGELRKEYTVEAVLRQGNSVIASRTQPVYRYERSPYLRGDGVYLKNKTEPFYPVLAYHVSSADYGKMAEAGINVVQATFSDHVGLRSALDAAAENNIMVLAALYRDGEMPTHPDNYDLTVDVLHRFKDHPALFGWMIMDEPFGNFPFHEAVEGLRESYQLIRSIDTEHPVYTLDNQTTTFTETVKYVDILATDPYPGSGHDTANYVAERIGAAVTAAKGEKPVYAILQAFEYYDLWPSGDQMRSMVYQAFLAGAAATGYYAVNDARVVNGSNVALYNTDLWDDLHTLAVCDYNVLFTGADSVSETEFCKYGVFQTEGKTYMAVYSKERADAVTDTVPLHTERVTLVAGNGTCRADTNGIELTMPACGAMLLALGTEEGGIRFFEGEQEVFALPVGNVTVQYTAGVGERLYAAVYKMEGETKRMERAAIALAENAEETLSAEITVPESGCVLKAFVWKNAITPEKKKTLK